jgi:outer membrane protein OmpA-like peptidoglycan-associated protein/tetratricopeptide (TPR) repeat protein
MKQVMLLFIFSFVWISAFAQEKNEWVELGDAAFKKEDYQNAISYYLKVITKEVPTEIYRPYEFLPYTGNRRKKENAAPEKNTKPQKAAPKINQPAGFQQYIIHQLADSYRLNHDYKNAEIWFKKSISGKPPLLYPNDRFWYGDALVKNGHCAAAIPEFEAIIKIGERKNPTLFQQAKSKIKGCKLMDDSTNYKKEIAVVMLDSTFNSGSASFSANYYGDQHTIQYASARNDAFFDDTKKTDQQFDCDIYTITRTDTGWDRHIKMENSINTEDHEAAGCMSPNKSDYYFTRWSTVSNECAIYVSKLRNQQWLLAEKLSENVNLQGFKSMQPCLSKDGSILYFSSNRSGGFGKMDLWYVKIDEKGKPEGSPVNMGAVFNTPEDEVTPFIHFNTSTLYYSSAGLPGLGGLDVFKSSYDPDSSLWSIPQNLGVPVNSSKDDAYFILENDQLSGFLSSDRQECNTCDGGACYKIYSVEKKPNVFQVQGSVYNVETNRPMPGVLLTFKDIHGDNEPFTLITDSLGSFTLPVNEGLELYVKAQKNGYFGDANTLSTLELTESKSFEKNFFLSVIPKGDIIIPGIEYDSNQASLKPESEKVLDRLVDFLNLNNNLKVEISSHTDERGDDDYNLKLSQDRAKVCVEYLIKKGIAADRLIPKGYGDTQPVVANAQTEDDHQKNRRTTLHMLSETEIKNK